MKEVLNTKGVYHPDQEIKIVQKLNAKENEQYWRANNLELIQMKKRLDNNPLLDS